MNAQTLIGLPEHRVELGGSLEFPHVINHAAKAIVAYVLVVEHTAGGKVDITMANPTHVPLLRGLPIPPGGSNFIDQRCAEIDQRAGQIFLRDGTPVKVKKVVLDSVLFADGEFVGPDKADLFMAMERGFKLGKDDALKALLDPSRLKRAQK